MVLAEFHWSWSCSGFGLHPLERERCWIMPKTVHEITSAQIQWETWHGLLLIGGKDDRGQSPSGRVCKNSSSMNWDPQNEEIPDLPTFASFILGIYSILGLSELFPVSIDTKKGWPPVPNFFEPTTNAFHPLHPQPRGEIPELPVPNPPSPVRPPEWRQQLCSHPQLEDPKIS